MSTANIPPGPARTPFKPAPRKADPGPADEPTPPSSQAGEGAQEGPPPATGSEPKKAARKGAATVTNAAQKPVTDAVASSTPEERRADQSAGERDTNVSEEATLANQDRAGEGGTQVKPRVRGEDRANPERPDEEDGLTLDAHAVNRARAAARDGEIDVDAFKDYLRGEGDERGEGSDGPEAGIPYSPTTLAGISEALHQDAIVLRDGRTEVVDAIEAGDEEVPVEDRTLALAQARQERATLEAEQAALDELEAHQDFQDDGVDSIDGDGVVESDGGETTPIVGLTRSDIDVRQSEIEEEIVEVQADIDLLAGTFTIEEEALIRDIAEADTGAEIETIDGDLVGLDDEAVDAVLADMEASPDAAPVEPEGAAAAPESPAPPTDPELLALAGDPETGVLNGPPEDYGFNEGGELVYYAQPGDGYWHAAEAVDPPAGQDFSQHWMNTWTTNSQRNHGVPNEPFVGIGQPVVIPGYTRESLTAQYAPVVAPAVGSGGPGVTEGAGETEEAEGAPEAEGTQAVEDLPADATTIPVQVAQGPTQSGGPLLIVGDTTVEVPPEDFQFEIPTTSAYARVPVSSVQYGEYVATIERVGIPGQSDEITYRVVQAVPGTAPAAEPEDEAEEETAPADDSGTTAPGEGTGSTPAAQPLPEDPTDIPVTVTPQLSSPDHPPTSTILNVGLGPLTVPDDAWENINADGSQSDVFATVESQQYGTIDVRIVRTYDEDEQRYTFEVVEAEVAGS